VDELIAAGKVVASGTAMPVARLAAWPERARRGVALAWLLGAAGPAVAALPDEIQVYDDAINRAGEFGLELHVNTTPHGRTSPDYPGEIVANRGWRVTPEFSYGVSDSLEAGLYLPFLRDEGGTTHFTGPKLRLKWLPGRVGEGGAGWFYGLNAELSRVGARFEPSRTALELRPILGYRSADWLFVTNPVLGYDLSPGHRGGGPDFSPSLKLTRRVAPGLAAGLEYYAEVGKLTHTLPGAEQAQTLYLVMDVDRAPWVFNLGIGGGLNAATDRWTLKAIFELPF
jgi:hypothetical protein